MPFSAMSMTIDAYVTEILTTKPSNRTMSPGEPAHRLPGVITGVLPP
jgi:hypothetical protein